MRLITQMASLITFPLIMIILLSPAEATTYWGDVEALKQLKNGLEKGSVSEGSCVSSWDFSVDPCDNLWSEKFTCGFRCDAVISGRMRVTEIRLDQVGYAGSLPSSWNLPYLETLDVSNNLLSGGIPPSLANLTRLRRLSLSANLLGGDIPSSIASLPNLQELYLDSNSLEGPIPPSFSSLASLQRLHLQLNNVTGGIPDLASLHNLCYLDLSDNALTGGLPSTLPTSLLQISLRNNSLSGGLRSESLRGLLDLEVLDLSHNALGASVPLALFQLPSLQQLTLSFNRFSSMEPPLSYTVASQSGLIAVDLSNNHIQGLLPWFMGVMPKLSALSLENNRFTGMIPTQYALKTVLPELGVSPFGRLILSGNYLIGGIPSPLLLLKPGSANVTLADNCLFRCPLRFFFCDHQKSVHVCNTLSPFIP